VIHLFELYALDEPALSHAVSLCDTKRGIDQELGGDQYTEFADLGTDLIYRYYYMNNQDYPVGYPTLKSVHEGVGSPLTLFGVYDELWNLKTVAAAGKCSEIVKLVSSICPGLEKVIKHEDVMNRKGDLLPEYVRNFDRDPRTWGPYIPNALEDLTVRLSAFGVKNYKGSLRVNCSHAKKRAKKDVAIVRERIARGKQQ